MINLKSFSLEKLDIYGKHYGLVQGMSLDEKIKAYIDRDFLVWLEKHQAVLEDKIEVGKMYAIIKDGRELGVVGSSGKLDNGILKVIYAVKKNVRGRGYGQNILEEVTDYYLDNIDGIKGIKLVIDQSNKASKGVARNNNYMKSDSDNGLEEWYYYQGDTKKSK